MSWEDPIINDVRAAREKLLEEHGGFEGLVEYLRMREKEHPERVTLKEQSNLTTPQTKIY